MDHCPVCGVGLQGSGPHCLQCGADLQPFKILQEIEDTVTKDDSSQAAKDRSKQFIVPMVSVALGFGLALCGLYIYEAGKQAKEQIKPSSFSESSLISPLQQTLGLLEEAQKDNRLLRKELATVKEEHLELVRSYEKLKAEPRPILGTRSTMEGFPGMRSGIE